LPLNKKINLKRVKSISKSRDVTSLEEEFMFQPEIEKKTVKNRGPLDWVLEQEGVAHHHPSLVGKRVDFLVGVIFLRLLGSLGREKGCLNP